MPVQTSAGSRLFIGTTATIILTDTFVEISEITNMGEIGRAYEEIKYMALGNRNVLKFKGQRDDGDVQLSLGHSYTDAGQTVMRTALDVDAAYNFKMTMNDAVTPTTSSNVTISIAAPGLVTWTAHGLVAGTPVVFSSSGALPTGITAGTTYYVIAAGLVANAFEISTTLGGSAVTTTGTQSGVHTAIATPGSPTTVYFKAKVMAFPLNVGSPNQVVAVRTTLAVDSGTIITLSPT